MDTADKLFPIDATNKSPIGKNTELFNNLTSQLEAQKSNLIQGKKFESQDMILDLYDAAYNKIFEASLLIKEAINYK